MLKVTACLIAVLAGLGVVGGVGLALLDQPPIRDGVAAVGCDSVSAMYVRVGDGWVMSVSADVCHPPGRAALSSEAMSFAALGAAAWQTPGPSLTSITITLGRSADRPDGQAPRRTLALTGDQAAARWGRRPTSTGADTPLAVRAGLGGVVWLCGFGAAGLSCVVASVLAARAARRGRVVVIWVR